MNEFTLMPRWHLRLLGRFGLHHGDVPVPAGAASRRLLAYLAVRDGSADRAAAATALWPLARPERAVGNLRATIYRTRRLVGDGLHAGPAVLSMHPATTVDLWACTALAEDVVRGRPHRHEQALIDAGDLLPDESDDWVIMARERFLLLRVRALETVCRRRIVQNRPAEAVAAGAAAVRLDPFRESAHRALIAAHMADGDTAAALRLYRCFRSRMRDELELRAPSDLEAWASSVSTAG